MRILLLSHRIPFPPNKGDKIRSFNILKYLSSRHEVHVACTIDDEIDLKFITNVQQSAASVAYVDISRRSRALSAVRGMAVASPITVAHFYSVELQQQVDGLLDSIDVDAVLCFSSPMAEYLFRSKHALGKLRRVGKVMDFIDVDSHKWAQYADSNSPPKSWIYRYEARQLATYEKRIAREFDHVLVVSEHERRLLPEEIPAEKSSAIGNGVDLEYFFPVDESNRRNRNPTIVFTGVMDYWPNIDGVRWFVQSIYPMIRKDFPDALFQIVGSRPTAAVLELAQIAGVSVTGFIPDVRAYLAAADVCVVPLQIARGIQNKVLEAMAMGKPVVCTTQAFEGIRAVSGEDAVVAGDAKAFADAVKALLGQPSLRLKIGSRARNCVEAHYSWEQNLHRLGEILKQRNSVAA